jgi:hypothetical protein
VKSAIGCQKYSDPLDCQALANLCALTLYDLNSAQCQFFFSEIESNQQTGFAQNLPWLKYSASTDSLLKTPLSDFDLKLAFFSDDSGRSESLNLVLASFDFNGTFLGISQIGSELSLCPLNYEGVQKIRKFGVQLEKTCDFPLQQLLATSADQQLPQANRMFELYLADNNGKLIDIPVLLNQSGQVSNTPSEDWQLFRRFFMTDSVSGVSRDSSGDSPFVVRFASEVKLKVQMDPDNPESIFRPYLIVRYREVLADLISESSTHQVALLVD